MTTIARKFCAFLLHLSVPALALLIGRIGTDLIRVGREALKILCFPSPCQGHFHPFSDSRFLLWNTKGVKIESIPIGQYSEGWWWTYQMSTCIQIFFCRLSTTLSKPLGQFNLPEVQATSYDTVWIKRGRFFHFFFFYKKCIFHSEVSLKFRKTETTGSRTAGSD